VLDLRLGIVSLAWVRHEVRLFGKAYSPVVKIVGLCGLTGALTVVALKFSIVDRAYDL
jgi:hypothetical protein